MSHHRDAGGGERYGDAPGADRELHCGTVAGQLGEQGDGGTELVVGEAIGVDAVVAPGDHGVGVEVGCGRQFVEVHGRILAAVTWSSPRIP